MHRLFSRKTGLLVILFSSFLALSIKAQLDPHFGTYGVTTVVSEGEDYPRASFLLPDGKILVFNDSSTSDELIRFNADGTPDASYGTNGVLTISTIPFLSTPGAPPFFAGIVNCVRQSDGKLVLIGTDNNNGFVVRLNENGTLDTTFSGDGVHRPNLDQNGRDLLTAVFQQPDGKLVAAAQMEGKFGLIRYETNGELDPTFGDQGGFIVHSVAAGNPIDSMVLQSSGKFLVQVFNKVFRINPDGTMDNTFTVPTFTYDFSYRPRLLGLSNQKFLLGLVEVSTDHLFRTNPDISLRGYNADGTVDTGFGTGGTARIDIAGKLSDEIIALAQQPDGKIVIAANTFVAPNRTAVKQNQVALVRLTTSGVVEGKYLVTDGENVGYGQVLIQPDGKIVTVSTKFPGRDLLVTRNLGVPFQTYRFHGIPFDMVGFGSTVPTIFRPGTRTWYIVNQSPAGSFFGLSDDILVPSDYFGDRLNGFITYGSELAVFRPSNGTWYIHNHLYPESQNFVAVQWGLSGDIPVPADYDGDSKSDISVFRPSNGVWYIRNSADESFRYMAWGLDGDKPVTGDYDGDGFYDIAVWRASDGIWYVQNSSTGPYFVQFGMAGDIPVQEDYDGDGKFDIAVWRPSTGMWYVLRSSDGGVTYFNWGVSSDVPVPADYDGDHKVDIAIFRPSTRLWHINYSSDASVNYVNWGTTGDIPLQGRH